MIKVKDTGKYLLFLRRAIFDFLLQHYTKHSAWTKDINIIRVFVRNANCQAQFQSCWISLWWLGRGICVPRWALCKLKFDVWYRKVVLKVKVYQNHLDGLLKNALLLSKGFWCRSEVGFRIAFLQAPRSCQCCRYNNHTLRTTGLGVSVIDSKFKWGPDYEGKGDRQNSKMAPKILDSWYISPPLCYLNGRYYKYYCFDGILKM